MQHVLHAPARPDLSVIITIVMNACGHPQTPLGVQHANPGMHACARAQYANSEYNSMGKTRNSKTVG